MTGNPENPERPRIAFYCIYISPPGRSSAKGGAATGPLGDVLLPAAQNSASENGEHFSLSIQIHHQSRNISDTRKNALTWGPRTHQCCHLEQVWNWRSWPTSKTAAGQNRIAGGRNFSPEWAVRGQRWPKNGWWFQHVSATITCTCSFFVRGMQLTSLYIDGLKLFIN